MELPHGTAQSTEGVLASLGHSALLLSTFVARESRAQVGLVLAAWSAFLTGPAETLKLRMCGFSELLQVGSL